MNTKRLAAVLALCAVMALGGCSVKTRQKLTDINPDDLGGIDVGVPMVWSPDYVLTGRTDLNLLRFDTQADALLALKYNRIDAYASERINANYVISLQPGFEILPSPIGEDSIVAFFSNDAAKTCEEFNAFVKEFMQTDAYRDIFDRANNLENGEYVVNKTIPVNENGPVLRMAITSEVYPYAGIDFETGEFIGFEVEIARWFAYECGYKLEVSDATYESAVIALANNMVDFYMSGLSSYYRHEVELTHRALVSEPYMYIDMVLMVVGDREALKGGVEVD